MRRTLCALVASAGALGAQLGPDYARPGPSSFLVYELDVELDADEWSELAPRLETAISHRLAGADAPCRARVATPTPNRLEVEVMGWQLDELELDWIRERIEGRGRLQMLAVAPEESEGLAKERLQLGAWIQVHPGLPIERFHATPAAEGGASGRWRWTPPWKLAPDDRRPEHERAYALAEPTEERWRLGQGDVAEAAIEELESGPAMSISLRPERVDDFAEFSAALVGSSLAFVVDGRVVSAPILQAPLLGPFRIQFSRDSSERERAQLIEAFGEQSLPARLSLLEVDERATRISLRARDGAALDAGELSRALAVLDARLLEPGVPIYAKARLGAQGLELRVAARRLSDEQAAWILGRALPAGRLRLLFEARETDLPGSSLDAERARLAQWLAANPSAPLREYNTLSEGGPYTRLRWALPRGGDVPPDVSRALPLLVPEDPSWRFVGADVAELFAEQDFAGNLALGGLLAEERLADWAAYTGAHTDRRMCYVLDDALYATQSFAAASNGRLRLADRFERAELMHAELMWRSGELPCELELIEEAR